MQKRRSLISYAVIIIVVRENLHLMKSTHQRTTKTLQIIIPLTFFQISLFGFEEKN